MKNILKKIFFGIIFVGFFILIFANFNTFIYAQSKSALGESNNENLKKIVKKQVNYVPGEVIVKYKNENLDLKKSTGFLKSSSFEQKFSLTKKDEIKESNIQVFKTKKNVEETIKELKADPNVEYIQPNYIYKLTTINTNDTYKDLLWGLDNTGQNVNGTIGTVDKDIDAPAAWGLSEGSGVVVAVIDSGVAYNHPDLINNMWDGSSCLDENGNSLGGCNHGYDYENNDKTPLPDTSYHGTHVAGIIAAEKNNSKGIIGVAPQTKIMAIKTSLTTADNIKSINFAQQNGAKVINASWGGTYADTALRSAISGFSGLFVTSAGNCGDASSYMYYGCTSQNQTIYPASFDLDNIISVAATDQNDILASFSNYSVTSVDVAAPGVNIYSTISLESTILSENFDSLSTPNVPSGWVKAGVNNNFGTYSFGGDSGNVLYGDLNYPYANNANTNITSSTYNLSNGGNISFSTRCDTEYKTDGWYDYMTLDLSSDGTNFTEFEKWDEPTLDYYNSDSSSLDGAYYYFENLSIPNEYRTANFKFRFRWVTNASDNAYDGCRVDDIKFTRFSDGSDEQYGYSSGTSMAAPHVAGAVAAILSVNQNLSNGQVVDIIENSGDSIDSLSDKIKFGKRINLYKAMVKSYVANRSVIFGVYRFYRSDVNIHFYSSSSNEINSILDNDVNHLWNFEGFAYRAMSTSSIDTIPLYRFYRTDVGVHFYTASETEKDSIISSGATNWNYEGVAYYVLSSGYTGAYTNVYRFYRTDVGVHFYTASETEKDSIISSGAMTWNYEGVAFRIPE